MTSLVYIKFPLHLFFFVVANIPGGNVFKCQQTERSVGLRHRLYFFFLRTTGKQQHRNIKEEKNEELAQ